MLAGFIRKHDVAVTDKPLLHFRRGGHSHRLDTFETLGGYARQVGRFARALRSAVLDSKHDHARARSSLESLRLWAALNLYLVRYCLSRPMRSMTWHYVSRSMPLIDRLMAHCSVRTSPAMSRLRARARALPPRSRVVIFGAGKHTRRALRAIHLAISGRSAIVGVCDDAADHCAPIANLPIITPQRMAELRPDLVLVSSDAYERSLARRAFDTAPAGTAVWCIYDLSLEAPADASTRCSIDAMNPDMVSMASPNSNDTSVDELALSASTNSSRCRR